MKPSRKNVMRYLLENCYAKVGKPLDSKASAGLYYFVERNRDAGPATRVYTTKIKGNYIYLKTESVYGDPVDVTKRHISGYERFSEGYLRLLNANIHKLRDAEFRINEALAAVGVQDAYCQYQSYNEYDGTIYTMIAPADKNKELPRLVSEYLSEKYGIHNITIELSGDM